MLKLSKESKERLQKLFKGSQFAICWGFIPHHALSGLFREPQILECLSQLF
uniref:Translocase of outer membrane 7 kDa subunit homolog n=1 Tax=Pelusios castaneus TaxID=367368 RepID=A0A8C8RNG2_9SAUR